MLENLSKLNEIYCEILLDSSKDNVQRDRLTDRHTDKQTKRQRKSKEKLKKTQILMNQRL